MCSWGGWKGERARLCLSSRFHVLSLRIPTLCFRSQARAAVCAIFKQIQVHTLSACSHLCLKTKRSHKMILFCQRIKKKVMMQHKTGCDPLLHSFSSQENVDRWCCLHLLLLICGFYSAVNCCMLLNYSGLEFCYTFHVASTEKNNVLPSLMVLGSSFRRKTLVLYHKKVFTNRSRLGRCSTGRP